MKRLLNPRPFFLILLSFSVGILLGYKCESSTFLLVAASVAGAGLLIAVIIEIAKKSKRFIAATICCLFLLVGTGVYGLDLFKHERAYLDADGAHIEGTVTDKVYVDGGVMTFYLRDVRVTVSEGTYDLSGYTRAKVSTEDAGIFSAGDRVSFSGRIFSASLFEDGEIDTYYYKNNIQYIATGVNTDSLTRISALLHGRRAYAYG